MKQSSPPGLRTEIAWKGDRLFESRNRHASELRMDGSGRGGLSPMETLLSSLCGCIGIDLVLIIEKMRLDLESLAISAEGQRNNDSPQYFKAIHLNISLKGAIPEEKARHALKLSLEKYCSVFHTLRSDLRLTHELSIEP